MVWLEALRSSVYRRSLVLWHYHHLVVLERLVAEQVLPLLEHQALPQRWRAWRYPIFPLVRKLGFLERAAQLVALRSSVYQRSLVLRLHHLLVSEQLAAEQALLLLEHRALPQRWRAWRYLIFLLVQVRPEFLEQAARRRQVFLS